MTIAFTGSAGARTSAGTAPATRHRFEQIASALAVAAVLAAMATEVAERWREEPIAIVLAVGGRATKGDDAKAGGSDGALAAGGRDMRLGGYGGTAYTHPSDVRIVKPGPTDKATDLTIHDVGWDGRPFKSPIYYGLRMLGWSFATPFGGMFDFTHAKAISRRDDVVRFSGTRDGKTAPASAKVGDTLRHFEFSHGHNMVTLNGLFRLATLSGFVVPYVGAGAGINIPHTEIQFLDDKVRTYMYQYAGPAAQALAGVEIRLARVTLFIEYKLSYSAMAAPLYDHSTLSTWYQYGATDFLVQLTRWWKGQAPEGGMLWTKLVTHHLIGGVTLPATQAGWRSTR